MAACLQGKTFPFGLRWMGSPSIKKTADDFLKEWGLSKIHLAQMPVEKFSTGMKRRLGLARIQLSQRKCLLLDEPLNGLDTQGVALFRAMLEKHRSTNGSAIVVSHETHAIRDLLTKELTIP